MLTQDVMYIKDVRKKVSGQGNTYYEVDVMESLKQTDEKGDPIKKEWLKLFYKPSDQEENILDFKFCNCRVVLNFYTQNRKYNEAIYTDIKVNIMQIEKA